MILYAAKASILIVNSQKEVVGQFAVAVVNLTTANSDFADEILSDYLKIMHAEAKKDFERAESEFNEPLKKTRISTAF